MTLELHLRFPQPEQFLIEFDDRESDRLDFTSPLTDQEYKDIRWYLETYGPAYTADVDDQRAQAIEARLSQWGEALFEATLGSRVAQRLFNDFQDRRDDNKLLTISASHPTILSLPWELLRDPTGTYLVHDNPRIAVRRRLPGKGGGRVSFQAKAKGQLRILFVVSRPSDAGFIDPRGEVAAVLDAIAQEAADQVAVEFLRPATLDKLVERLEDKRQPAIDIVHFDGHGAFDPDGSLHERAKQSDPIAATKDARSAANTGYLLFENNEGESALITADTLGDMLNRQEVGLMVLSACQSAAIAGEDAMGCVAARLTHAGIPAVLAMSYSVLVTAARQLFATFYLRLLRGEGTGEALANARRDLFLNKERGERRREQQWVTLKLQDWFLPTLYQTGSDRPLLLPSPPTPHPSPSPHPPIPQPHNLKPLQESGFFGRSVELWQIERAFVQGTRRISISGFGGQGKTSLAEEAGRWLHRTGLFTKVCFIDYARYQGLDSVSYALSVLGEVLGVSLPDTRAAAQALGQGATLIILDNLEALQPEPLRGLLTVAKDWSEVGACRLLTTSRNPELGHPDYANQGTLRHQTLPLRGLGSQDALAYWQRLVKLPPAPLVRLPDRDQLMRLFGRVDFHPLSIGLLAVQVKDRPFAEVDQALARLIAATPDNPLLASLNLSLARLEPEVRAWLPRLGVFEGGAWQPMITAITELGEEQWARVAQALAGTGLVQVEDLADWDDPFLRFHPTLAPVLAGQLTAEERDALLTRYRRGYYELAYYLYVEDRKTPEAVRGVARRELPNLLAAVRGAITTEEHFAVEFVECVNEFLEYFGLTQEQADLTERVQALSREVGSQAWFLSRNQAGEQLFQSGRYGEAAQIFVEILTALGETASYERCLTLLKLGRCLRMIGQLAQAEECYRQGLAGLAQLAPSDSVTRQRGVLQADLADVLTNLGRYGEARTAYEASLTIAQEQNDDRHIGVVEGQLGTLAMLEGNLPEAEQRYRAALTTFQQLYEPASEAVLWHQLGYLYYEAKQWDSAEQAYRASARLAEEQGVRQRAAETWLNLANVNKSAGKPEAAEAWYQKALAVAQEMGDRINEAMTLSNLADLLQDQRDRLPEAQQLAEAALTIDQTLDPAAAEIWNTYGILAEIADKQGQATAAAEYRRLSRQARANFAGTQHELKPLAGFIMMTVIALENAEERQQLEVLLEEMSQGSTGTLAAAIQRILNGERNEAELLEPLNHREAMIVSAILQGIRDPDSLRPFLP